jgi:nitrite reductase (NO-forming)
MLQVNRRQLLKAGGALGAVSTMSPVVMASASEADLSGLPRVKQELVAPPYVPAHEQTTMDGPKIIEVELTSTEDRREIDDDGTMLNTLSFNGWIPGPLIICHEGDYVELTLKNPASNVFEHNIDFHASTGALGGGALTLISPGEQVKLRWKATKPGTYIYHCAPGGSMIPFHVVSGMNGAVMVLPRDGLKDRDGNPLRYDRAYYIGEQDYYVPRDAEGNFINYPDHGEGMADMFDVMQTLTPTHVVFNGRVGALTGDNAMTANVGETVLFIHSQANRDSRPHLIGGHGDYVWEQGSFADPPAEGLETWFIRGGSAGAALYTFRQSGAYVYLSHNLIEAVQLGALAIVSVQGEWDHDLMTQVQPPTMMTA